MGIEEMARRRRKMSFNMRIPAIVVATKMWDTDKKILWGWTMNEMPAIVVITDPPISVILWRNTVRVRNRGRPPIWLLSIYDMRKTMVTIGPLASQTRDGCILVASVVYPLICNHLTSAQSWKLFVKRKRVHSKLKNHLGVHFGRNYPPKKSAVCLHYPAFFSPDLVWSCWCALRRWGLQPQDCQVVPVLSSDAQPYLQFGS